MEINETFLVEELMDGEGHCVADPEDCSECVGAEPHMGNRTEVLEGSILLLERETHRIALAVDLDLRSLDLNGLTASDRLHEITGHGKAGSGRDPLEEFLIKKTCVSDYLYVVDRRSIVQGYELNLLVSSLGPHPTFGKDFLTWLALQQVFYLRSG